MSDLLFVLGISGLAAFLTVLGGVVAEIRDVPKPIIGRLLQLAGGVLTALVAVTLMAPAVRGGSVPGILVGFFIGGAAFVLLDYVSARHAKATGRGEAAGPSTSLFVGVLVDMLVDGMVIGVASTMTVAAGLALAVSVAISTAPLALVSISLARETGLAPRARRILLALFGLALIGGAILGFFALRNASDDLRFTIIAVASGFLITTVTQSIIPEANRDGEPSLAALFFVAGISLYTLFALQVI